MKLGWSGQRHMAMAPSRTSAEREEMLEWAGGEYDPFRFDLAAASAAVAGT